MNRVSSSSNAATDAATGLVRTTRKRRTSRSLREASETAANFGRASTSSYSPQTSPVTHASNSPATTAFTTAASSPSGLSTAEISTLVSRTTRTQVEFATIETGIWESMKDELGRRMKRDYEDALRLYVPRRTHVVVRIDGRAFHQFTRELERPYCRRLAGALDKAAVKLAGEMIGCRFAYGQSDEYSFVLADDDPPDAALWFDGNIQKIVSVSASIFTAAFNNAFCGDQPAAFDSRLLVIAQRREVEAYLLWRQLDASANSLNML